jgi:multidrug efflux pump subunit AcrB
MHRDISSGPIGSTGAKTSNRFNLSTWAIDHGGFTAFVFVLLLAAGAYSLLSIGRKEDPDFTFRTMVVQVSWPGATVDEMQDQVVDKIERKLQETPGLDFLRSYTRSGFANIFVNLKGSVRGDAVKDAFYQVRKKIGDIRQTLPEGVVGPFFNDEFGDTYISLHAVTGQGFGYPELKNFAKRARDVLLRVPGVAKVDLLGTQDERVFIEVSSAALAERGLTARDIQAALAGQNAMDPAGRIETGERSVRIDVGGLLKSVEDIRELRLHAGQQTFRLGDIAEVKRGLEDPPSARTHYQGREAVLLGTTMAAGAKVTEVGAAIEQALGRIQQDLPVGVEIGQISDQARVVTKSIREFLEAFGEAIGIVLVVSFIALGWRAGLVVALTIPMVLAATFLVMSLMGIDLHRISLGALVISLGLLVDDAMIAVEMAVYVTPWMGYRLLKAHRADVREGHVFNSRPYAAIRAVVAWCVRRRRTIVVLTVAVLVASIAGFAFIPKQFFPTSNRPEILVDLWLPEGSSFETVERTAQRLERVLMKDPDLADVTTFIGEGAPRFYLPLDQQLKNPNFAQLLLMSTSIEARERVLVRIRDLLAHDFPDVRFKADRLFNGPPVGWPVQVRVTGPDRGELRRLSSEIAEVMRTTPEVSNVHNDWLEPVPSLKLDIDQDRARALGVTSQDVRRSLQATLSGFQIGEFRDYDETIEVVLREPGERRTALSALDSVYVKTAAGTSVPLRQVARFNVVLEPGIQWRRDRLPSITVQGLVPDGVQSPDVAKAVFARLKPLRDTLAPDYRVELQGAVEESAKSQDSINAKMPAMLVIVLVLLMIQLQHFGKTMMVLATAPLGVVGAAGALLMFDAPFGFVAILGVIALAGIIMRNSVILVDQIDQDIAAGHDMVTAIVESAVRRFRPITLTAAAAVLALIPLAREVFWAPMALAMMGGIIAATVLTLTFLPALYALAFRAAPPQRDAARTVDQSQLTPVPAGALQAAE